jgi:hypothetical protein
VANFKEQRDLLRAINEELGKKANLVRNATKEVSKLESITQKLQNVQSGILTLTDQQAKKESERASVALQNLRDESDALQRQLDTRQKSYRSLTDQEKALLAARKEGFTVEKETVKLAQKEVRIREGIQKSMGLTGVLAKSLKKTLGVDLSSALKGAQETARKVNEEFENSDKGAEATAKRAKGNAKVFGEQIKGIGGAALKSITSIQGVLGLLAASFLKFNKVNREARQLTGQTADNFTVMNDSILNAADQVKTITSLSSELGINVNAAFSAETIAAASELTQLLGISEKSTAALAQTAEAFGQDLAQAEKEAVKQVKALAKSGKGALNFKQVLEESGNASGRLQLTLGKTPGALQEAAAEAQALGLSLDSVEKVADSLLNFEQSISSELEAELLTGKQINLDKARSLALNNDIAGLTKEIGNNQEILNAFADGNRIQQNAIAQAMGLSVNEISEMIFKQKIAEGLSTEQAAKAANINEEEAKRLDIQAQMQKSIEKMTMAAAPLVESFASLLGNAELMYTVIGALAAVKLGGLVTSIMGLATSLAAAGVGASATANALTLGVASVAIIGGIALVANAVGRAKNKAKKEAEEIKSMKDGVIDAQGGLMVSGPKGSISLDREDTIVANKNGVIAGTNLGGNGAANAEMLSRLDRLISATEKGSQITMDGNLVGKSIANNTSALG